jgi:hypothetical protein
MDRVGARQTKLFFYPRTLTLLPEPQNVSVSTQAQAQLAPAQMLSKVCNIHGSSDTDTVDTGTPLQDLCRPGCHITLGDSHCCCRLSPICGVCFLISLYNNFEHPVMSVVVCRDGVVFMHRDGSAPPPDSSCPPLAFQKSSLPSGMAFSSAASAKRAPIASRGWKRFGWLWIMISCRVSLSVPVSTTICPRWWTRSITVVVIATYRHAVF